MFRVFSFLLVFFFSDCFASQRVESLYDMLSAGTNREFLTALDHIEASKIGDPRVMNVISGELDRLYEQYSSNDIPKKSRKQVIYLLRAIVHSKNEKSLATIRPYTKFDDRKIRKQAEKSLQAVQQNLNFIRQAKELRERIPDEGLSLNVYIAMLGGPTDYFVEEAQQHLYTARVVGEKRVKDFGEYRVIGTSTDDLINNLQSDNLRSAVLAAQRVFYTGNSDKKIHKVVSARLKSTGGLSEDAISWFCKALAASGDEQYLSQLEELVDSDSDKVKFHAGHSKVLLKKFKRWYTLIHDADALFSMPSEQLATIVLQAPYLQIKDASLHYFIGRRFGGFDDEITEYAYQSLVDEYPYISQKCPSGSSSQTSDSNTGAIWKS